MHSKVVAIKMSGRHLILVICSGRELADLEEVEAERLHLSRHAVECRRANGYRPANLDQGIQGALKVPVS